MSARSDLQGWLELRAVKGLGPITYTRLINQFGSPQAIQRANLPALVATGDISSSLAQALQQPLSDKIHKEIHADNAVHHSSLRGITPGRWIAVRTCCNNCALSRLRVPFRTR